MSETHTHIASIWWTDSSICCFTVFILYTLLHMFLISVTLIYKCFCPQLARVYYNTVFIQNQKEKSSSSLNVVLLCLYTFTPSLSLKSFTWKSRASRLLGGSVSAGLQPNTFTKLFQTKGDPSSHRGHLRMQLKSSYRGFSAFWS